MFDSVKLAVRRTEGSPLGKFTRAGPTGSNVLSHMKGDHGRTIRPHADETLHLAVRTWPSFLPFKLHRSQCRKQALKLGGGLTRINAQ